MVGGGGWAYGIVLGGRTFEWNVKTFEYKPTSLFEESLDFLAYGCTIRRLQ